MTNNSFQNSLRKLIRVSKALHTIYLSDCTKLYYNFYDSEEYLDFINTLSVTVIFQHDVGKRRAAPWMVHGSRLRPLPLASSKYLENQIFVVCKNYSIYFVQSDILDSNRAFETLIILYNYNRI